MADISKCRGIDCPLKERCFRFLTIPSRWQSYFHGESGLSEDKTKCENIIEVDDGEFF
jgi:hypothetical protein